MPFTQPCVGSSVQNVCMTGRDLVVHSPEVVEKSARSLLRTKKKTGGLLLRVPALCRDAVALGEWVKTLVDTIVLCGNVVVLCTVDVKATSEDSMVVLIVFESIGEV